MGRARRPSALGARRCRAAGRAAPDRAGADARRSAAVREDVPVDEVDARPRAPVARGAGRRPAGARRCGADRRRSALEARRSARRAPGSARRSSSEGADRLRQPHVDAEPAGLDAAAAAAAAAVRRAADRRRPDRTRTTTTEMRDIFLEEAREVIADAHARRWRQLASIAERPGRLTTVRRAFHTLKGSSRMVGLKDFGEAAWACEQLYNTRLAEQRAADADAARVHRRGARLPRRLDRGHRRAPRRPAQRARGQAAAADACAMSAADPRRQLATSPADGPAARRCRAAPMRRSRRRPRRWRRPPRRPSCRSSSTCSSSSRCRRAGADAATVPVDARRRSPTFDRFDAPTEVPSLSTCRRTTMRRRAVDTTAALDRPRLGLPSSSRAADRAARADAAARRIAGARAAARSLQPMRRRAGARTSTRRPDAARAAAAEVPEPSPTADADARAGAAAEHAGDDEQVKVSARCASASRCSTST